jgi:hypothetical protein
MNLSFESKVALVTGAAVHEALNGKLVEWMEKVSDVQYAVLPS